MRKTDVEVIWLNKSSVLIMQVIFSLCHFILFQPWASFWSLRVKRDQQDSLAIPFLLLVKFQGWFHIMRTITLVINFLPTFLLFENDNLLISCDVLHGSNSSVMYGSCLFSCVMLHIIILTFLSGQRCTWLVMTKDRLIDG